MIDYWEAIGRLATYGEMNRELQGLPACNRQRNHVEVFSEAGKATESGLVIDQEDFEQVQRYIEQFLQEQSLSLLAAGELIWDFSFSDSRAAMTRLNNIIDRTWPKLYGPSVAYFITLGKIIVDELCRNTLLGAAPDRERELFEKFPRLSKRERVKLAHLVESGPFEEACVQFGRGPWDRGCFSGCQFSPGYIQQTGIRAEERDGRYVAMPWSAAGEYGWKATDVNGAAAPAQPVEYQEYK